MTLALSWQPAADQVLEARARQLSVELGLPLVSHTDGETDYSSPHDFLLTFGPDGLSLVQLGPTAPGPLRVSFADGRELWRLRHGGGRGQLIARALSLHKMSYRPTVLDVTAGLGRDAFVLAGLGCTVTLMERSPIVGALLADGLDRLARCDDGALQAVAGRMTLHCCDALDGLAATGEHDVVYLDPMFPARGRATGVKKEMQMFRALLPEGQAEAEQADLLAAAIAHARHRVVVKRMKQSPLIDGPAPSYQLTAKAVRYDIYTLRKF